MKYFFLFFPLIVAIVSCSKDRPVRQLPPDTQTGAGTLGFKIDNQVNTLNYPYCFAAYQHLSPPLGDGYFLVVSTQSSREDWYLGIQTDSLKVETGGVYSLKNVRHTPGAAAAKFAEKAMEYHTSPSLQGELRISKLDTIKNIVSGTFWFDAEDASGKVVQVRDGRFDLHYTE